MATIWQRAYGLRRGAFAALCEDRPLMQQLTDGGLRLELTGPDAVWIIELTSGECEQIADEIGRPSPAEWPSSNDKSA